MNDAHYSSGVRRYENPVYVQRRALALIRSWPEIPEGSEHLVGLLIDAGILSEDEDREEGDIGFSRFGERVKEICRDQNFNFWLLPVFLDLLPVDHLAQRTPPADAYMRVLQLDWNSRDVRTYISERLREQDGTIPLIRQPPRDLLSMMSALGEAFDRLTTLL